MNMSETYNIRSVSVRSRQTKMRLLMPSSMVEMFQQFLKETIENEVVVVNTNISMQIYYYSKNDYSHFIRESVLLYVMKRVGGTELKFQYGNDKQEVFEHFSAAMYSFAKYPQLFLAYSKKILYIKKKYPGSRFIMPVLIDFFEDVLRVLGEANKIPHIDKIKRAKNKSQSPETQEDILRRLVSEILLKKHNN